jgi:CheY-like chemotaxis protein
VRVLVVDDDRVVREGLDRVLRHDGLEAVLAGDGAWAALAGCPPDATPRAEAPSRGAPS